MTRGEQYGRAARHALFYAACATAWIIGSSWITRHVSDAAGFELIKGLGFVAATSCLLFLVLVSHDRRARQAASRRASDRCGSGAAPDDGGGGGAV